MKRLLLHSLALALVVGRADCATAAIDGVAAPSPAVAQLLASLQASEATAVGARNAEPGDKPELVFNADGTVRHLSAPAGTHFRITALSAPEAHALVRAFLDEHAAAFGLREPAAGFKHHRTRDSDGRTYVKLDQTADGLPVFGGQIIAQLGGGSGVEYLVNQTARLALQRPAGPLLDPETAAAGARQAAAVEAPGLPLRSTTTPVLVWFVPELLSLGGEPRLAYDLRVYAEPLDRLHLRMFVDAVTGERLFQYSFVCHAKHRSVFNADNNPLWPPLPPLPPPVPSRVEFGSVSGNAEVNDAFNFIGDTYDFYFSKHGRRGIGGSDKPLFAVVRVCQSGQPCPWANASWTGSLPEPPFTGIPGQSIEEGLMLFGQGWAVDDIVGHEYTHGVTQFESGLIYANASGAINEAFSDIWGEFVDQINGAGNDTPAQRWQMGEDLPNGSIRSMNNPPLFRDPDRLGHTNLAPATASPNRGNDWGGVHSNSGVINKLCSLLTDGGTFRGYTISSRGMDPVVALFYEVNANLLTATADFTDLSHALRQAALNLGWSASERANLHGACLAVEITPNHVDAANTNPSPNGSRQPGVNSRGPWPTVAQGLSAIQDGDPLWLRGGNQVAPARINKPVRLINYNGPTRLVR